MPAPTTRQAAAALTLTGSSIRENSFILSKTQAGEMCIRDSRNIPHSLHRHVRPDKDCQDIQPAVSPYYFSVSVKEILNTAFPIIIPAQDGGKRRCV